MPEMDLIHFSNALKIGLIDVRVLSLSKLPQRAARGTMDHSQTLLFGLMPPTSPLGSMPARNRLGNAMLGYTTHAPALDYGLVAGSGSPISSMPPRSFGFKVVAAPRSKFQERGLVAVRTLPLFGRVAPDCRFSE